MKLLHTMEDAGERQYVEKWKERGSASHILEKLDGEAGLRRALGHHDTL